MKGYYVKVAMTLTIILTFSVPVFASGELEAAIFRLHAVKSGKIKSVEQFKKMKDEEKYSTKVERGKMDDGGSVSIERKVLVDKKDNIVSKDLVKGRKKVLMEYSKTKRKLGESPVCTVENRKMGLGDAIEAAIESNYGIRIKRADVELAKLSVLDAYRQVYPSLK